VDVVRWDVNDPTNGSKALESKAGYDIDGLVLFTRDAQNHQSDSDKKEGGAQARYRSERQQKGKREAQSDSDQPKHRDKVERSLIARC